MLSRALISRAGNILINISNKNQHLNNPSINIVVELEMNSTTWSIETAANSSLLETATF